MPVGLNISPSIWQLYINAILDCLQSRKYCVSTLLRALLKNGLKISPRKCQLFRTSLQYMGNEIFIQNRKVYVQPLRNRLEAIQRLQPPNNSKRMQKFCGDGKFSEYVLSRTTEIAKAYI